MALSPSKADSCSLMGDEVGIPILQYPLSSSGHSSAEASRKEMKWDWYLATDLLVLFSVAAPGNKPELYEVSRRYPPGQCWPTVDTHMISPDFTTTQ